MTSDEIRNINNISHARIDGGWPREIAYQLALMNEKLDEVISRELAISSSGGRITHKIKPAIRTFNPISNGE